MTSTLPVLFAALQAIAAVQGDVSPGDVPGDVPVSATSPEAAVESATTPATTATVPPAPATPATAPTTAAPTTTTTPTAAPVPDVATAMWSVGGGAVFGNNVVAIGVVERRLAPWLWVYGAGSGGNALAGTGVLVSGTGSETDDTTSTVAAQLRTGVRFQLFDDHAFARPSLVLGLAGNVERRTFTTEGTRDVAGTQTPFSSSAITDTAGAEVFGGALVDFSLLPWLALRFSTDIGGVGVFSTTRTELATSEGEQDRETTSSFSGTRADLSLRPALSLQAFF